MALLKCFQLILKEMDDEISDDELDEIILEVCSTSSFKYIYKVIFQIDVDNSQTIDFQEFIKIMS